MKALFIFFLSVMFLGCDVDDNSTILYETEFLKIEQVADGTFVHVSYLETQDYGKVGCNGMVFIDDKEAIIFDTPASAEASAELIEWVEKQDKKIRAVVPTHFHGDGLVGLKVFHEKEISSFASKLTVELARNSGVEELPEVSFDSQKEFRIGNEKVIVNHFGEGHTRDNVVAYLASTNTLFGGCLIKSVGAGKGNLADANVEDWSETVEKIKSEYSDVQVVIPGHGSHGNRELLDFTIQLFQSN